ncbi:MAG: DUF1553 domain-containing protein, partial [Planctomycetota bacterium]
QQYQSNVSKVDTAIKKLQGEVEERFSQFQRPAADEIAESLAFDPRSVLDLEGDTNNNSITGRSYALKEPSHQGLGFGEGYTFRSNKAFSVSGWVKPTSYGAILSRMAADDTYQGFDMLINPDGRLSVHLIHDWPKNAIKITTNQVILKNRWTHVVVSYGGGSHAEDLQIYFNGVEQNFGVDADKLSGSIETKQELLLGFRHQTPPFKGQIAGVQVFNETLIADEIKGVIKHDLAVALNHHNAADPEAARHHWLLQTDDEYLQLNRRLVKEQVRKRAIESSIPTVMVMKEAESPRATYVLDRGQYDKPIRDEEIYPKFPAVLEFGDAANRRLNRLDLAQWITHRNNPLTARVAVNRIWSQLFGVGIHKTVEDFGIQSPQPTHIELLDFLAVAFVDSGWDLKRLIKMLVTSATYRQSSHAVIDSFSDDPQNLRLARGSRFRLSAEAIRDNALAISGLLSRRVGGPSVKPYQPDGLWDELAGGAGEGKYVMDRDENLYRRSLYTYRKRTVPHPTMSTFDASSREICQVGRQRTNTPLQALALLNDKTYVEAARHLAIRTVSQTSLLKKQIEFAFRSATARRPMLWEVDILTASYQQALVKFQEDPDEVAEYLTVGVRQIPNSDVKPELAALAVVCSMILNLDETITRE